ncbi:MAG: hypothetical protein HON90_05015 [Halobacteriovoraceae bacterium]|jgi:hypothetical protein|nr:hypothetical protein [Halobacteriovoraceae bacterium]
MRYFTNLLSIILCCIMSLNAFAKGPALKDKHLASYLYNKHMNDNLSYFIKNFSKISDSHIKKYPDQAKNVKLSQKMLLNKTCSLTQGKANSMIIHCEGASLNVSFLWQQKTIDINGIKVSFEEAANHKELLKILESKVTAQKSKKVVLDFLLNLLISDAAAAAGLLFTIVATIFGVLMAGGLLFAFTDPSGEVAHRKFMQKISDVRNMCEHDRATIESDPSAKVHTETYLTRKAIKEEYEKIINKFNKKHELPCVQAMKGHYLSHFIYDKKKQHRLAVELCENISKTKECYDNFVSSPKEAINTDQFKKDPFITTPSNKSNSGNVIKDQ